MIIEVIGINLAMDEAKQVYNQTTKIVFVQENNVNEAGIILIGSLASIMKKKFRDLLDDFWNILIQYF